MHSPHIPKPVPPPPVPTIDTAVQMRNNEDRALRARKGAATSLLTSPNGLPDLGASSAATATGA
ncbi:hypothetical protein UFOVP6_13 [uncultured Caudovirales phage]|uniref:Uncharacterized protein n=1 Tax=uncultured Caudovirales phage TaxID=2100421 RepID=A0A6J5KGH4_9CAUD|nr:hypothetical protein UFOVP6_13 [uncultured Caudovirales phage]